MYEVVDKDTTKFEFWLFVCGKTGGASKKDLLEVIQCIQFFFDKRPDTQVTN